MKDFLKRSSLLHFAARAPVYYRRLLSERQMWHGRRLGDTIFPLPGVEIRCPDHAIAHSIFESHAFEYETNGELKGFVRLSEGCSSLLDLGASGGFFSALFVASRQGPCRVASVEPDPNSIPALQSCRKKNLREGVSWDIREVAVGGREEGTLKFVSEVNGYGLSLVRTEGNVMYIEAVPFHALCESLGFVPNLIKSDIESMEYEVVDGGREFLGRHKPRLHLELHSTLLEKRQKDPIQVMRWLFDLGYRALGRQSASWADLKSTIDTSRTQRFDLVAA